MPRKDKEQMIFTKVKKKTVEDKRSNMEKVRDLVDQYSHVYVFAVHNFRNPLMKQLKQEFECNGRFFQGKVKPTMVALGKNEDNEYRHSLHLVSNALEKSAKGAHRGLFFTNNKHEKILPYFEQFKVTTFAKTGFVATTTYVIRKGVLNQFVFSQEFVLKKLGLPVVLRNGRITLDHDHVICEKGQPLKPEQCKLIELLNITLATFSLSIHGYWTGDEFYECVHNNSDDNKENDDDADNASSATVYIESAPMEEIDDSKKKSASSIGNTEQPESGLLDDFVADDSSDDDDAIRDID
eukprot:CAMPEP_0202712942 /NCGR_PEP_ID=MMETSP1385-20130828/47581_1 /ASSEMBLY_ACC=CAM_ASM_000861 /TAXON_ID=933848 /ORGANISM="Elphidium margaritaceum" /LENGTH=295 /DNA_ID=CAMNT_0049373141 /DNA_START=53 /DNA_END=940 /DNA_ORIENTATION=+